MQPSKLERPAHRCQVVICAFALLSAGAAAHAALRGHRLAPPQISGTPATTDVAGSAYSFTPSATGPSGHTLTFSISRRPSWASFSTTTGRLSGTPTSANVGTFSRIVISVSDGAARASLPAFAIRVSAAANAAPSISGQPATAATVGTAYSFTPQASGANGDALSFSITNKPSCATFSIATGTISGTPAAADVGTDSGIVISVSNGEASASLAPFSITVSQPAGSGSGSGSGSTGTATLTWTAPTTNTDGSALTDLAGYHVYYGTSASALTTVVDVANPATMTYTVTDLASGTWYFAVNAYTTSGLQSALSNPVSKSIP